MHGTLAAVLAAPAETIGDAAVAAQLGLVRAAMLHALRTDLARSEPLTDQAVLERYLFATAAHLPSEQMRVLFLDGGNALICDEVLFHGTVNSVRAYPRELLRRAIELGATALILVHNHPGGDPEPTLADIVETRRLCAAAESLDIAVHDHLVVGRRGVASMRARGLMLPEAPAPAFANDDLPSLHRPARLARALHGARDRLRHYFDADLFADPALEMLLGLFIDGEDGVPTSTGDAFRWAGIASDAGVQWLTALRARGLVEWHDGRHASAVVRLTPDAARAMRAYLTSVGETQLVSAV